MIEEQKEVEPSLPAERLFSVLSRPKYKPLLRVWNKAVNRIDLEPQGAITAAKTLVEGVCKLILDHFKEPYSKSDEMPVLYFKAALKLGIAVNLQTGKGAKKYFGSVATIIQSISEMRNLTGDAHYGPENTARYSTAYSEAQLAVNLAGSATMYILSCFETYLIEHERKTPEGNLVLAFDKTAVWHLIDHTRNAQKHRKDGDEVGEPGLWLVGDTGIYLMSNGLPRINMDGEIGSNTDVKGPNLCVWADGYDYSNTDFNHVNDLHRSVEGGSDFHMFLEVDQFLDALPKSETEIIVVLDISHEEYYSYQVFTDTQKNMISQVTD